jgi:hypothetical protein
LKPIYAPHRFDVMNNPAAAVHFRGMVRGPRCTACMALRFAGTIPARQSYPEQRALEEMIKFLLWCILLVLCWPLALLALILYPLVWLVLLPFRILGIAVGGALELVSAVIVLPVRMLHAV